MRFQARENKRVVLLMLTGLLLMSFALYLNTHTQLPDFIKGIVYGIGFGLEILFTMRVKKLNRRDIGS